MKLKAPILSVFFCTTLFSCASTVNIPQNATSAQLIQLGQDALYSSRYSTAETYYTAVIKRYGMDISTYIEATYELGHLYLKQKKYEAAYQKFDEIISTFENAEPGVIPAAYKKLASMGIEKIPEKYRRLVWKNVLVG